MNGQNILHTLTLPGKLLYKLKVTTEMFLPWSSKQPVDPSSAPITPRYSPDTATQPHSFGLWMSRILGVCFQLGPGRRWLREWMCESSGEHNHQETKPSCGCLSVRKNSQTPLLKNFSGTRKLKGKYLLNTFIAYPPSPLINLKYTVPLTNWKSFVCTCGILPIGW